MIFVKYLVNSRIITRLHSVEVATCALCTHVHVWSTCVKEGVPHWRKQTTDRHNTKCRHPAKTSPNVVLAGSAGATKSANLQDNNMSHELAVLLVSVKYNPIHLLWNKQNPNTLENFCFKYLQIKLCQGGLPLCRWQGIWLNYLTNYFQSPFRILSVHWARVAH